MAAHLDTLTSGGAAVLGRPLTGAELDSFEKYLKLLQKWQRAQRLIGSSDPAWIVENLFLDSLLFLRVLPEGLSTLADVGSGAGLPGIPIKIVRPEIRMVLIESRDRRASFLSAVVRELNLAGATVVRSRVEQYATEQPASVDAVAMRCAGPFPLLVRSCALLLKPGGLVVASGPPDERSLDAGTWKEVEGWRAGTIRRFAVYRKSGQHVRRGT